jgi:hypothetical protein
VDATPPVGALDRVLVEYPLPSPSLLLCKERCGTGDAVCTGREVCVGGLAESGSRECSAAGLCRSTLSTGLAWRAHRDICFSSSVRACVQLAGGSDGLGVWAARNRSIVDTDLVVWCVSERCTLRPDAFGRWADYGVGTEMREHTAWPSSMAVLRRYSVGFHHVTLQENMPVLPTFWGAEFSLAPANFFLQNPALDLPRAAR